MRHRPCNRRSLLALNAAALTAVALALAKPSEGITATSLAATTLAAANTPEESGAHANGER